MKDSMLLILGVAMVATAALGAAPIRAVHLPGDPVGHLESMWEGPSGVVASYLGGGNAAPIGVVRAPGSDAAGSRGNLSESSLLLMFGGALLGATWILRRFDH